MNQKILKIEKKYNQNLVLQKDNKIDKSLFV